MNEAAREALPSSYRHGEQGELIEEWKTGSGEIFLEIHSGDGGTQRAVIRAISGVFGFDEYFRIFRVLTRVVGNALFDMIPAPVEPKQ